MPDLFGNPDRLETANGKAVSVSLFDAAAEALAYESGRALSQVRTELVHGASDPRCAQCCTTCGAWFVAVPRLPATCNLCRRHA